LAPPFSKVEFFKGGIFQRWNFSKVEFFKGGIFLKVYIYKWPTSQDIHLTIFQELAMILVA